MLAHDVGKKVLPYYYNNIYRFCHIFSRINYSYWYCSEISWLGLWTFRTSIEISCTQLHWKSEFLTAILDRTKNTCLQHMSTDMHQGKSRCQITRKIENHVCICYLSCWRCVIWPTLFHVLFCESVWETIFCMSLRVEIEHAFYKGRGRAKAIRGN